MEYNKKKNEKRNYKGGKVVSKNESSRAKSGKSSKSAYLTKSKFAPKYSNKKSDRQADVFSYTKGRLSMTTKGFAFVIVSEGEDIFIPASKVNGALNGDLVKVKYRKTTKGPEGNVVDIIQRGHNILVGKVIAFNNNYYLEPNETKYGNVSINSSENLVEGETIVVAITDYGEDGGIIKGDVIEKIDTETKGGDILEIIREYELYEEFSPFLEKEAKEIAKQITEKDLKNRQDLRNVTMFTIDGVDAKDFDDAVSLNKTKDGYSLGVHIADVAHYVTEGSTLDKEAFARGTSVYFPDRVLPMLPTALSNEMCSLNANVDRLTLSVLIDFDINANVKNYKICESVINSNARLTYDEVYACLSKNKEMCEKYSELTGIFDAMQELSQKLIDKRNARGALDFDFPECYIVVDEKGKTCDIKARERNDAHRLIESFMLVANEVVAEHFQKLGLPFVYRVHEKPTPEKMKTLFEFISAFNIKCNANPKDVKPADLKEVLKQAEGKPFQDSVSEVLLRSLQKARYTPRCLGHFGLSAPYYCHFTSPIRRYPDLSIHRIIKLFLNKKLEGETLARMADFVIESSERSSEREKLAERAEREVDAYKKTEYMAQFVGKAFDAKVSSVTQYGIYVVLDNTVDGKVSLESLPDDFYKYNEATYALVGKKHKYTVGDPIKVTCVATNLKQREVYFEPYKEENKLDK